MAPHDDAGDIVAMCNTPARVTETYCIDDFLELGTMKIFKRKRPSIFPATFGAILAAAVSGRAAPSHPPPLAYTQLTHSADTVLDGQWLGRLEKRAPYASIDPDADPLDLRIDLHDTVAKIYSKENGQWQEVMPGRFKLTRHYASATMIGMAQSHPESPSWVETWTLLVAIKDDNTVLAEWARIVVNARGEGKQQVSPFSMGAVGTLTRVTEVAR